MKHIRVFLFLILFANFAFAQQKSTPATALQDYMNNGDKTYAWEVKDSYKVNKANVYSLLLISQKWQGLLWKHELLVFVPDSIDYDGALLFVNGGSLAENGLPNITAKEDKISAFMADMSDRNKAVVAVIRQVPNQALYGGLVEDALIAYTLDHFRTSNDYSWPLLFPMVKSARKAMDAVQEFVAQKCNSQINRFVVSGASKRGWTSWLTAASQDQRVVAIAPMVIDMLNMPATLEYQKEMYGAFSEEIQDYVKIGIPQSAKSEFGSIIVRMIDPYSYRDNLTQPKMIILATNDPYWTVDAVKHYYDGIPGYNLIHYAVNAGHDMGDKVEVMKALSAFLDLTLNKQAYPKCGWTLSEKKGKINLSVQTTPDKLLGAKLWLASSSTRDFRKSVWTSSPILINEKNKSEVQSLLKYPKKDFQAFYIDLIYQNPKGGDYSVSTRTFVADKKQVFVK